MIKTATIRMPANWIPDERVLRRAEIAARQCIADGLRCSYAAMRERGAVGGHIRIADAIDALEARGVIAPLKLCRSPKGHGPRPELKPAAGVVVALEPERRLWESSVKDYRRAWRSIHRPLRAAEVAEEVATT